MPDTRVCDESLVNHMGSLVGRTTSHHALYDGAVCVVCGMRACGSLVGCTTNEPPCVVRWCGSLVLCSEQAIAMKCDAGSTCSERLRRWGSWGYR